MNGVRQPASSAEIFPPSEFSGRAFGAADGVPRPVCVTGNAAMAGAEVSLSNPAGMLVVHSLFPA